LTIKNAIYSVNREGPLEWHLLVSGAPSRGGAGAPAHAGFSEAARCSRSWPGSSWVQPGLMRRYPRLSWLPSWAVW